MKVIRRDSRHHRLLTKMVDHEWHQQTNNEVPYFNDLVAHGMTARKGYEPAITSKGMEVLEWLKEHKSWKCVTVHRY